MTRLEQQELIAEVQTLQSRIAAILMRNDRAKVYILNELKAYENDRGEAWGILIDILNILNEEV